MAGEPAAGPADGPFADPSVAELVAGGERGVLVSDRWYTRLLDPRTLVMTGLTATGVADRGRSGRRAAPELPVHAVHAQALIPGNVKAVWRLARPILGDSYGATSPHLAPLDVPRPAPGGVELHRRSVRLTEAVAAEAQERRGTTTPVS